MSPAAPAVVVFQLPTSGHVNPLVPILEELVERGCDVATTSVPAYADRLGATGARLIDYPPIVAEKAAEPPTGLANVCALLATMTDEPLLRWSLELLDAEQPDVVIVDSMAPWGRLAAAIRGIPCVSSSTTFVLHDHLDDSLAGRIGLVREVLTGLPDLVRYARARRHVRRVWGSDPGSPLELLAGLADLTIAHTSREIQPGADRLDDPWHPIRYIGTAVQPASPGHPELADLPDGPLIYASLGTLYNARPDFFRNVLAGLAEHPGPVLLSIGSRLDVRELGSLPANAHVRRSVPQLAVLARAEAFITHGGMNSTTESLVHGVPMVFAPQTADQPLVARRVSALGAGTVLRGHCPKPEMIARAVDEVRRSGMRDRAAELGRSLLACGGTAAAADAIMHLAVPRVRPSDERPPQPAVA